MFTKPGSLIIGLLTGTVLFCGVAQAQNNRLNSNNDPDVQRGLDNYRRPEPTLTQRDYDKNSSSGTIPSPPPNGSLDRPPPRYVPTQRPVGR